MKQNKEATNEPGVRHLTMLSLPEGVYFIDLRLKQFREVNTGAIFIDFDSEQGQRMCRRANVLGCDQCGAAFIVSSHLREQGPRCPGCCEAVRHG